MNAMKFYLEWATTTFFGLVYKCKYSKHWDIKLNQLIDKHWQTACLDSGHYCVQLGDVQVWIANAYCAFGDMYKGGHKVFQNKRPSVRTMFRLTRLVHHLKEKQLDEALQ